MLGEDLKLWVWIQPSYSPEGHFPEAPYNWHDTTIVAQFVHVSPHSKMLGHFS